MGTDADVVDAFVAVGGENDKSGHINADYLKQLFSDFNLTVNLDQFLSEVDVDGNKTLDFDEFSALLQIDHEAVTEEFEILAASNNGSIPLATMRSYLVHELQLSAEVVDRLLVEADEDHSGMIELSEFTSMLSRMWEDMRHWVAGFGEEKPEEREEIPLYKTFSTFRFIREKRADGRHPSLAPLHFGPVVNDNEEENEEEDQSEENDQQVQSDPVPTVKAVRVVEGSKHTTPEPVSATQLFSQMSRKPETGKFAMLSVLKQQGGEALLNSLLQPEADTSSKESEPWERYQRLLEAIHYKQHHRLYEIRSECPRMKYPKKLSNDPPTLEDETVAVILAKEEAERNFLTHLYPPIVSPPVVGSTISQLTTSPLTARSPSPIPVLSRAASPLPVEPPEHTGLQQLFGIPFHGNSYGLWDLQEAASQLNRPSPRFEDATIAATLVQQDGDDDDSKSNSNGNYSNLDYIFSISSGLPSTHCNLYGLKDLMASITATPHNTPKHKPMEVSSPTCTTWTSRGSPRRDQPPPPWKPACGPPRLDPTGSSIEGRKGTMNRVRQHYNERAKCLVDHKLKQPIVNDMRSLIQKHKAGELSDMEYSSKRDELVSRTSPVPSVLATTPVPLNISRSTTPRSPTSQLGYLPSPSSYRTPTPTLAHGITGADLRNEITSVIASVSRSEYPPFVFPSSTLPSGPQTNVHSTVHKPHPAHHYTPKPFKQLHILDTSKLKGGFASNVKQPLSMEAVASIDEQTNSNKNANSQSVNTHSHTHDDLYSHASASDITTFLRHKPRGKRSKLHSHTTSSQPPPTTVHNPQQQQPVHIPPPGTTAKTATGRVSSYYTPRPPSRSQQPRTAQTSSASHVHHTSAKRPQILPLPSNNSRPTNQTEKHVSINEFAVSDVDGEQADSTTFTPVVPPRAASASARRKSSISLQPFYANRGNASLAPYTTPVTSVSRYKIFHGIKCRNPFFGRRHTGVG